MQPNDFRPPGQSKFSGTRPYLYLRKSSEYLVKSLASPPPPLRELKYCGREGDTRARGAHMMRGQDGGCGVCGWGA